LTRRFDIGPVLVAIGAIVLLVGLFLRWYGGLNAWDAFELADVLLAALAVAALLVAAGLLAPEAELLDRRTLPWLAGAAFVVVAAELINPPPGAAAQPLGLGAWLSFAASLAMVVGAVLTFGRVSLAVAVEGRDRRRRVAAVDHRPPPTETGAPVARSSESLLRPREDEGKAQESP
jgi:hypothetical protein